MGLKTLGLKILGWKSWAENLCNFGLKNLEILRTLNPALIGTRKSMLSERKRALAGVDKLHNYTKANDYTNLHGTNQVLSLDISRRNAHFVTGGADNMGLVLRNMFSIFF